MASPLIDAKELALLRREIESLIGSKSEFNAGAGTLLALKAASMGDLESIRSLQKAGADLKRRDAVTGETPMEVAATAGHFEIVSFLQESGGDPATNAVRMLIRRMRSSTSEKDMQVATGNERKSFLRQTSFISPPTAIYLNRTVVSTPAGDLSLEDVFNEVKQEGQKKISVVRELPMALTIMGLYWSPYLQQAALADSGCDVYHLETALEQLADDVYGDDDYDLDLTEIELAPSSMRPRSHSELSVPSLPTVSLHATVESRSRTRSLNASSAGTALPLKSDSHIAVSPHSGDCVSIPGPVQATNTDGTGQLSSIPSNDALQGGCVSTKTSLRLSDFSLDSIANSASSETACPALVIDSSSSDVSGPLSATRQPPGPPPRERRPTRPPVTPEMSPQHGAVRASIAAASGDVSSLLQLLSPEMPSQSPRFAASTSPALLDTLPITRTGFSEIATCSSDALQSSPQNHSLQQAAKSSSLPDRRMDFTTFCTTVAMLQAAGAYKHSIEKTLHLKDKERRRQVRLARYASETDPYAGHVDWPAPSLPQQTQPAPVTASRLNFARQRSYSISGASGSTSLLLSRPPLGSSTSRTPTNQGVPTSMRQSSRGSTSSENSIVAGFEASPAVFPPPALPMPRGVLQPQLFSRFSTTGSDGGAGSCSILAEEDIEDTTSSLGSSRSAPHPAVASSTDNVESAVNAPPPVEVAKHSGHGPWSGPGMAQWPSSVPPGPLQRVLSEQPAAGGRQVVSAREPQVSARLVSQRSIDSSLPQLSSSSRSSRRSMFSGYAPLQAAAAAQSVQESRHVSARGMFRAAAHAVLAINSTSTSPASAAQMQAQQHRLTSPGFQRPSAAGVHAVAVAHSRAIAAAAVAAGSGTGDATVQRSIRNADDKFRRQSTTSSGGVSQRRRDDLRVRSDLLDMSAFGGGSARFATPEEAAAVVGLMSPTGSGPGTSPLQTSAQAGAAFRTNSIRRMNATPNMADVVRAAMRVSRSSVEKFTSDNSRSPANSSLRRMHRGSNGTPTSAAAFCFDGEGSVRSSRRSFNFSGVSPQPSSPARSEKMFFPTEGSHAVASKSRRISKASMSSPRMDGAALVDRISLLALTPSAAAAVELDASVFPRGQGLAEIVGETSNVATPGSPSNATPPLPPDFGAFVKQPMRPSLKSTATGMGLSLKRLSLKVAPASPGLGAASSFLRPMSQRVSFSLAPDAAAGGLLSGSAHVVSGSVVASVSTMTVSTSLAVSDSEASASELDTDTGTDSVADARKGSSTVPLARRQSLLTKQGSESQLTVQSTNSGGERLAEVFLGGACNPTRWRFNTAMPFLDSCGITYYNPQVDDWYPELVEQEAKAKDEADVVFFVVGPETRAIASMIEVAEIITSGRDIVLVLQDIPRDMVINGNTLPPDEVKDLNRGRAYLANVADRHNVTVYQSLEVALHEASGMILRRRADRAAQFVEDNGVDSAGENSAAEDSAGENVAEGKHSAAGDEESAILRSDTSPDTHFRELLQDQSSQKRQEQLMHMPQRPSLTSAIADLASQFAQDQLGVNDAISEDDDEERRDCEDDGASLSSAADLNSIVGISRNATVTDGI